MGRTIYIPDHIEEPYLEAAEGDIGVAKEMILDTLGEHAPGTGGDS